MCPVATPPMTAIEPVVDILHGVPITDPYRWLEDQESPRTRAWIRIQQDYARNHLDGIPGRDRLRQRVREFLDVESSGSFLHANGSYFFRKRLRGEEQPSIYMRESIDGKDILLLDQTERGNRMISLRPVTVSSDARFLLYEVKHGGERTGRYELFDICTRQVLPDALPRGYLRGFAFAGDNRSFYYAHDRLDAPHPHYRAVWHHRLGTPIERDTEIFFAGEDRHLRLCLVSDRKQLGFLIYRFGETTRTSFWLHCLASGATWALLCDVDCVFGPRLVEGRVFAITDRAAPNLRIVEVPTSRSAESCWTTIVPESTARIEQWVVAEDKIVVSYNAHPQRDVLVFDLTGKRCGDIPAESDETLTLAGAASPSEVFVESQSFTHPVATFSYSLRARRRTVWSNRKLPFLSEDYGHRRFAYRSKDGTVVPLWLVGRKEALDQGTHPVVMTSYGGYGISMTPQFSVLVALLLERGCLFALPSIRGGSEFGASWHSAAIRHHRQLAYDDFIAAAEWLIATGRTVPTKLGIFGGSNSGLLVGAALTQRPELFRVTLCMVPLLDMLRYHLFDNAHVWKSEYGTSDDPDDFVALKSYSPYHQVREGVSYPATLFVSGDADGTCNPMHARKMAARLQVADTSGRPILLDYNEFRGHVPVLPLGVRIEALADRVAFLCEQLGIPL
jgi:prolyl oligopeptidase